MGQIFPSLDLQGPKVQVQMVPFFQIYEVPFFQVYEIPFFQVYEGPSYQIQVVPSYHHVPLSCQEAHPFFAFH
jgi:hypothetical protein